MGTYRRTTRGLALAAVLIALLLTTACGPFGDTVGVAVTYTPPFGLVTFALHSDGSITVSGTGKGLTLTTPIGDFSAELDASLKPQAPPEPNAIMVVIRHFLNASQPTPTAGAAIRINYVPSLVDSYYKIAKSKDELTVVTNGRTTIKVTNKTVMIDASDGSIENIEVSDRTDKPDPPKVLTYKEHTQQVNGVAWSPDGAYIASASSDGTVRVWDAAFGRTVTVFNGQHGTTIFCLAWSPDSKRIASGSSDGSVAVWDALTGQNIFRYDVHKDAVHAVAWSPDGKQIASGSIDDTVKIWDPLTGAVALTYKGHKNDIQGVAWSPDGTLIASASNDNTVQVWEAATGNLLVTYKGHADNMFVGVQSVAWSPQGDYIASGASDNTVQVWTSSSGDKVYQYDGHVPRGVQAVVWLKTAPGAPLRIASGASDGMVKIWDALTGDHVTEFNDHCPDAFHCHEVLDLALSPDGKRIASASADNTVVVRDVD